METKIEKSYIPIIDFETCGLEKATYSHEDLEALGKLLVHACSEVGFVYLQNTGISSDFLKEVNDVTEKFFTSLSSEKKRYDRKPNTNFGYIGIGKESFNPNLPRDYKEAFNADGASFFRKKEDWPDDIAPGFSNVMLDFMERSRKLSLRVLHALAIGLELKDEEFFYKCHSDMHSRETYTTGRTLYYPPINDELKPGQQRLLEHSDFTSISLVFQDMVGGLQVQHVNGEYVDATPVEKTVLVNIGDTMQYWTGGKLKSTKHRVIVPENECLLKSVRRSLAYFVHPNNDVYVNKPLEYKDESLNDMCNVSQDKLITSKEYLMKKSRALWEVET